MTFYTREQIITNRERWITFLENPRRKKVTGRLDIGGGHRCCLGHACYTLGIPRKLLEDTLHSAPAKSGFSYLYGEAADTSRTALPSSALEMLGLRNWTGDFIVPHNNSEGITIASLVEMNDRFDYTPQQIAKYLRQHYLAEFDSGPFIGLKRYNNKETSA